MEVNIMIIELSPELEARVNEWGKEFGRPGEELAVELLEEYFEDSDTGAAISEAVRTGMSELYSWEKVKSDIHEMAY